MSEDAAERRKRLKALKEKAANKSIKFRNYRPQDAAIKQQALESKGGGDAISGATTPSVIAGKGNRTAQEEEEEEEDGTGKRKVTPPSLIQQELKRQKETQDEEELNIAPKKANWDLKRDVEKKLEKLNRRTQRAIVEIIRERMAEEAANASSSEEEGSEGSSSGDEESGANLQRSCDSISPYGKPPLICGRPFKEAVTAPSLLTGLGLNSSKLRRDVWTADAGCFGPRRLCFRSKPIHDLVASTLLSIDPSGVFSMYEEWSNIKNRVLSRGLDEQRSDLAMYEELRQEDDDSCVSEDDEDAKGTTDTVFPERSSQPGDPDSNSRGGGARKDNEEPGCIEEREQGRTPGSTVVAHNQEHSRDRSEGVVPPNDDIEEAIKLGAWEAGALGNRIHAKPCGEHESSPLGVHDLPLVCADDAPPAAIDEESGVKTRRRRRRREKPHPQSLGERAANLDYARNLDKEPGLPPLRLLRESSGGALKLRHMALGDPHVMALLASLDHLPSLTSIDVSDNRIGSTVIQKVVLTAEEQGVSSLDLSSNHVDRASSDMLCACLARSGSLSSLIVKNAGVGDLAGAAIMAAIGKNTVLKTLDLSGNDIGGTSDLLANHPHEQGSSASYAGESGMVGEEGVGARAGTMGRPRGGVAIATCLESNYWLMHLDLSWNKIGEANAATIGASIEHNQGLRWLSLAGNRVGDLGAFSIGAALVENSILTHLDVSCNGISRTGAVALAHGLRANSAITNIQIQWLIGQLADGPAPLNNAELLEMMAVVAPQVFNNDGLADLIESNLSSMGCRMLVAQLGEAYPAFTGGVSGPFVLDLRFPAHRLAAVRLAEEENLQERNVKYKPTRAAANAANIENWVGRGGGNGQEGATDDTGPEDDAGHVSGDGEEEEGACAARAAGAGDKKTGLGESMAAFFQRGLSDRPTGVLELDFVCTLRPPEGTQPISDLALARVLNSCGMLDPNFWYEYLRPTNFPLSFVDLIRLLRVKLRGDRRQAKLLVLLLRVKNSMFRTARAEKKWKDILAAATKRRHRVGGALAAFQKSSPQGPMSKATGKPTAHATSSNATATDRPKAAAAMPLASASSGANQRVAPPGKSEAAPAEGSAVGSGGSDRRSYGESEDDRFCLGDGASGGRCGRDGGLIDVAGDDVGNDAMEWASRFCEPETSSLPPADSEEGVRLGRALARHVARDGDAGLIGTRWDRRGPFAF
eukprot:g3129.t1